MAPPSSSRSASAVTLTDGTAPPPFLGWSSWSVESTKRPTYGTHWLDEAHVLGASAAMADKLGAAGYRNINIDSFWNDNESGPPHYTQNGVPLPDPTRFPDGIDGVAAIVHARGQRLGLYAGVGLDGNVYNGNFPIAGTNCHTQDIAAQPLTFVPNGWNGMYEIDWTNPCAQAYYNSVADTFASWGVDLLKVDGTTAVSGPDIEHWQAALKQTGRPMWLTVSAWPVPLALAPEIADAGQSVRVDTDVECYCSTVSSWSSSVSARWNDLPAWLPWLGPGHYPDLDSMPINNDTGQALQDGINDVERQSVMTFWSMASSPLYVGGDIYFMDAAAQAILSNPEVIAVDQAAVMPKQVVAGTLQVWSKPLPDGTLAVAVYNLGASPASITVDFARLALPGDASLRDLVARSELGVFTGNWTASGVPAHGSRLVKLTTQADGIAGYTFCAAEYQRCNVASGMDVAFGARGSYVFASGLSGAVDCVVGTFGSDPAYGSLKGCYTRPHGGGGPAGYTWCSGENGTCSAVGVVDVAYGAVGQFAYRTAVSGSIACNNTTFGDPAAGYGKGCYTRPSGGGVAYEAESGALGGGAVISACSGCSGGKKVGYLGAGGRITLSQVDVASDGNHRVTLHAASADPRTLYVSVNGGAGVPVAVQSSNWSTPTVVTITLPLTAGINTLAFYNDGGYAPDLDRVVVD
jgi:hypothetical protein